MVSCKMCKRWCQSKDRASEDKKITFHKCPIHKPEIRELWKDFVVKNGGTGRILDVFFLCSSHFEEDCFRKNPESPRIGLRPNAIPTIVFTYEDRLSYNKLRKSEKRSNKTNQKLRPKINVEYRYNYENNYEQKNEYKPQNEHEYAKDTRDFDKVVNTSYIELCRLCVKSTDLKPISNSQYAQEFNNFSFIETQIGFCLPEKACVECISVLDKIGSFLKMCEDSYSLYETVDVKVESNDEQEDIVEDKSQIFESHGNIDVKSEILTVEFDSNEVRINTEELNLEESLQEEIAHQNFSKNDSTKYTNCHICSKQLHKSSLSRHLKRHDSLKKFKCTVCDKSYSSKSYLTRHMNFHTHEQLTQLHSTWSQHRLDQHPLDASGKPIEYNCKFCDRTFSTLRFLEKHTQNHRHKCRKCNLLFENEDLYQEHIKTHVKTVFSCTYCPKRFGASASLNRHLRRHVAQLPISCSKCDNRFQTEFGLQQHLRFSHREKKKKSAGSLSQLKVELEDGDIKEEKIDIEVHELRLNSNETESEEAPSTTNEDNGQKLCITCGALVFSLSVHYKTIPKCRPRNTKCPMCTLYFTNVTMLLNHQKAHHWNEIKATYSMCHHCPRKFKFDRNLRRHLQQHESGKRFMCELCGKTFMRNFELKEHMYKHKGLRPYSCKICGKSFNSKSYLYTHEQKHRPGWTYKYRGEYRRLKNSETIPKIQCSYCPKKFKDSSHLDIHERVHTGDRPYACSECGKTFRQSAHLNRHKRTVHHTNAEVLKCKFCDKTFFMKCNLVCHERIHTGEKPYKCDFCDIVFADASTRRKHVIKKHGEEKWLIMRK